jgi:hypothetical protein
MRVSLGAAATMVHVHASGPWCRCNHGPCACEWALVPLQPWSTRMRVSHHTTATKAHSRAGSRPCQRHEGPLTCAQPATPWVRWSPQVRERARPHPKVTSATRPVPTPRQGVAPANPLAQKANREQQNPERGRLPQDVAEIDPQDGAKRKARVPTSSHDSAGTYCERLAFRAGFCGRVTGTVLAPVLAVTDGRHRGARLSGHG